MYSILNFFTLNPVVLLGSRITRNDTTSTTGVSQLSNYLVLFSSVLESRERIQLLLLEIFILSWLIRMDTVPAGQVLYNS